MSNDDFELTVMCGTPADVRGDSPDVGGCGRSGTEASMIVRDSAAPLGVRCRWCGETNIWVGVATRKHPAPDLQTSSISSQIHCQYPVHVTHIRCQ